jgi:hypothetical protein
MIQETITIPCTLTEAETDVALARSELLDAFSDLEARISGLLKVGKADVKCQHLGAKVELFRKLQGISHPKRDQLAGTTADLLPLRADIVHSRMQIRTIDGTATGIFVNSQNQNEVHPLCRLLTAEDLRQFIRKLAQLTDELGKLGRVSPASSPPPPSPDAADGP